MYSVKTRLGTTISDCSLRVENKLEELKLTHDLMVVLTVVNNLMRWDFSSMEQWLQALTRLARHVSRQGTSSLQRHPSPIMDC